MEMNDELVRTISNRSKRTLDTLQEQFVLKDTERRQKITTGDALFGNNDK